MVHGAAVDLCLLLVAALIGTMLGAFILKASCALYNLLAGALAASSGPPTPRASERPPETRITNEPDPTLALKDDWTPRPDPETPLSVPWPSFEWAMCIVFVAALVNILAGFVTGRIMRLAGPLTGFSTLRSMPIYLVLVPLGTLMQGGIIAAMLPTRFGKGLLIALIDLFLGALIAVVLYLGLILVGLSLVQTSFDSACDPNHKVGNRPIPPGRAPIDSKSL
jgi:hypothetical protein